jgi:hypothetical protein
VCTCVFIGMSAHVCVHRDECACVMSVSQMYCVICKKKAGSFGNYIFFAVYVALYIYSLGGAFKIWRFIQHP